MKPAIYSQFQMRTAVVIIAFLFFKCGCSDSTGEKSTTSDHYKVFWDTFVSDTEGFWVEKPETKKKRKSEGLKLEREIEALNSIGYLAGYKSSTEKSGVTAHDSEKAYNGLNLCLSGHKAEAVLMDMKGKVMHSWHYPLDLLNIKNNAINDFRFALRSSADVTDSQEKELIEVFSFLANLWRHAWRRAHLFENGDLIAIYEGHGMIKIDRNSRLKWFYQAKTHHDFYVADNGDLFVLTNEIINIPELNNRMFIFDDFICRLDPNGNEIERISLIECFKNSAYASIPFDNYNTGMDVFHTNTLEMITQSFKTKHPAFKVGNFLVSMRNLDLIAIVNIRKKSIEWLSKGTWRTQHEPQLIENGNIILFDNTGFNSFSRILELNPYKNIVEWEYTGNPPENFHSILCGSVQPLPNGNVLVTETCSGKAFEVTREKKEVVWEYYNPYQTGKNNELIAALVSVVRLRPNFPIEWLVSDHP